ncbi:hypothetical protein L7F22_012080 [Adiantum nelumboides]|nr:hypothetical protein [Adiantum nelumboides]
MSNHERNMQIVSEKLTGDNFHAWKFRITNYLKGKGYWDYVEGANEAPPVIPDTRASAEQVKALKDWHQGSAKMMYWLSINVSNSIVGHIQDADSLKDAWDNLIAFNATNTRPKKIQLKNELNTIKKGDLSVNDYTLKIKALCESLSFIGVTVDDDDKALYLSNPLHDVGRVHDTKVKGKAATENPLIAMPTMPTVATNTVKASQQAMASASASASGETLKANSIEDPHEVGDKMPAASDTIKTSQQTMAGERKKRKGAAQRQPRRRAKEKSRGKGEAEDKEKADDKEKAKKEEKAKDKEKAEDKEKPEEKKKAEDKEKPEEKEAAKKHGLYKHLLRHKHF